MKSAVEIFFNFFSMKSAVEFFSSIFCSKSLKTKHFIPDAPTDLGDFSFLLYLLSNVKETNHMLRLGGQSTAIFIRKTTKEISKLEKVLDENPTN